MLKDKIQLISPRLQALPPGTLFRNPLALLAMWFGSGLIRPAPGTCGSIAAIPVGFALYRFTGTTGLAVAAAILFVLGTFAAGWYGRKSGEVDDQSIVVDEVVGLWIAALPAQDNLRLWALAFVLFRVFDIFKPWPASWFDNRKSGGFDVMMDDVVAGAYALLGVAAMAVPVLLRS